MKIVDKVLLVTCAAAGIASITVPVVSKFMVVLVVAGCVGVYWLSCKQVSRSLQVFSMTTNMLKDMREIVDDLKESSEIALEIATDGEQDPQPEVVDCDETTTDTLEVVA